MALPDDPRRTLVKRPSSPWRAALERWIRIIQGNFDHFDGVITEVQKRHNALDDNVQDLVEFVNDGLDQVVEHTHEDDGEGGVLDAGAITLAHTDLTGVTGDQHHAKAHDHTTADGSGVLTADEHDSYSEIAEIADPSAPAANKARLYVKDNGSGKTQLVVLFPSGAVQVLITEP